MRSLGRRFREFEETGAHNAQKHGAQREYHHQKTGGVMGPCPRHVAAFKTIKPAHQKKGKACKKSAQPVHKAHGAGIGALTPQPVLPGILIHNAGAHQIHGGDGAGVAEAEQAGSGERRHK